MNYIYNNHFQPEVHSGLQHEQSEPETLDKPRSERNADTIN